MYSRVVSLHRFEDRLECGASAHCRFKRISFERFRVAIKYLDDDDYYRRERNRSTGTVAERPDPFVDKPSRPPTSNIRVRSRQIRDIGPP